MSEKEWMKEGIDLRLEALLFKKKIWFSLAGLLFGVLLAAGIYFLTHVTFAPAREYEAVSKLYLTFATDENGDAYQYYNGYTWNDLMQTEPIMNQILANTSSFDEALVREAVSADILSDIRLLTVTVRSHDKALTDAVIRATENAVVSFGDAMEEFDKIEVIEHGIGSLVIFEDETVRVAIFGGVVGLLISVLYLAFLRTIDTSIYVPSDFEKRYHIPVLNVTFENMDDEAAYYNLIHMRETFSMPKRENLIIVPYGKNNGKVVEREISAAAVAGRTIQGAIIEGADYALYKSYFAFSKKEE